MRPYRKFQKHVYLDITYLQTDIWREMQSRLASTGPSDSEYSLGLITRALVPDMLHLCYYRQKPCIFEQYILCVHQQVRLVARRPPRLGICHARHTALFQSHFQGSNRKL